MVIFIKRGVIQKVRTKKDDLIFVVKKGFRKFYFTNRQDVFNFIERFGGIFLGGRKRLKKNG